MFSGIVEGLEQPLKITKSKQSLRAYALKQSMRFTFPVPSGWRIKQGESVSIDGICSTVESTDKNSFTIFYMEETLKKTSLLNLSKTHKFNLERSLRLSSVLGGHMVSGHVDTTAKVVQIRDVGESCVVVFKIDPSFTKYIIYKGSIAVNGVSLTIVSVDTDKFTVSLIPYTLSHTNLGSLKKGDTVNIELDLIAKYLEKLCLPYLRINKF